MNLTHSRYVIRKILNAELLYHNIYYRVVSSRLLMVGNVRRSHLYYLNDRHVYRATFVLLILDPGMITGLQGYSYFLINR